MKPLTSSALAVALLLCGLPAAASTAEPAGSSADEPWTGTPEQRLWGLMQVWSETKAAFPHFEARPGLDWDAAARDAIPRALAAPDRDAYYAVLMELVATLGDGHTLVLPPWGYVRPDFDGPPVELQVVDGRFLVARAADTTEIQAAALAPGTEILAVEGVPVRAYFEDHVLRTLGRGVAQADEAINLYHLLQGPAGSRVSLSARGLDGAVRAVELTRDSTAPGGAPFAWRFVEWNLIAQHLVSTRLENGVRYVAIPSFGEPRFTDEFLALVDSTATDGTRALVIDLRYNLGGNSRDAEAMIAGLIDKPAATAIMRYPHRVPALRAWGEPEPWSEKSWEVAPRAGRRFAGPIVILTAGATNSTAEDFALMLRGAGRAVLVGGPTAGSSGNALVVPLPGGGQLRVSTFAARCPDGTQYVGRGLMPDVPVAPTAADVRDGLDPVLERGVATARTLADAPR
jgi:C-terminal processing protease CtpA/Prc